MREDLVGLVIYPPRGRLLKIGVEPVLTKFSDIRDETGKISLAERVHIGIDQPRRGERGVELRP